MSSNNLILKRVGKYLLIACVLYIVFLYFIYNSSGNVIPNEQYIDYKTGNKISLKKICENKNIVFIYFNPTCDSCTKMFENIDNQIGSFKKILVTSSNDKILLDNYVTKNSLLKSDNIILIDSNNSFARDFGLGVSYDIPVLLFYNNQGEFIEKK